MPLNPVDAQHDVHSNDTKEKKALKSSRDVAEMEPAEMYLSVVAPTEQRCVEQMLLDRTKSRVRHLEIFLGVIVEASQRSYVADGVYNNSVNEKGDNHGGQDRKSISGESGIIDSCRRMYVWRLVVALFIASF